jgi:hypothetical protein
MWLCRPMSPWCYDSSLDRFDNIAAAKRNRMHRALGCAAPLIQVKQARSPPI